jgi:LacI family transcriptional regulator
MNRASKSSPAQKRARKQTLSTVTLADVATLARVSTASVSRALNSPESVSSDILARVNSAAKQLRWIPNGAAKALASSRTGMIGTVIPSLSHQNFSNVIEALQAELSDAGYTLLLGFAAYSRDRELQQAREMIERGVECMVLIGEDHSPLLYQTLREHKIPYVVTYTNGRDPANKCVGFDNYEAYGQIVQHLLDLGHRQFAIVAQRTEDNDRVRQRVEAARDTLAAEGIAIRPQHYIQAEHWSINCGRQALCKIWETELKPTAVICTNDYLAAGTVFEANKLGIRIPEELSIAGFDDIELAENTEPPLTTVHVPDYRMGKETARFVIALLAGEDLPQPPKIVAELIVRGSTSRPPNRTSV